MTERELITLALGNYATLVAAQWANGTTCYDVTRPTLYTERSIGAVCGGVVSDQLDGCFDSKVVRVPRLVMLDGPHATKLKLPRKTITENAVDGMEEEVEFHDDEDDNEEDEIEHHGNCLYTSYSADGVAEEQWKPLAHHCGLRGDPLEEEEESQRQCRPTLFCDPESCRGIPKGQSRMPLGTIKRQLFCEKDSLVPWWQYIRGGVSSDSLHVLHPLHSMSGTNVASGSDLSLLHNFGFGMSQLRSSCCKDIAGVLESLRRQLEDADTMQGMQCFIDGDSAFGGAAFNVLEEFWEDAGPKVPVVLFTCFQQLPTEIAARDSEVDFASRRKDELCLNRLLATAHLSRHESAVYIPMELEQWQTSFTPSASGGRAPSWLQNDISTAQLVAALADSAIYGVRDNGTMKKERSAPAFHLQDWQAVVRPTRHLRVAAALASIPMHVRSSNPLQRDLWDFLEKHPLLFTTNNGSNAFFAPLTHAVTHGPQTDAGRVLGHTVALRGAGHLEDLTYSRHEALLRYALPLKTADYLPIITNNSYPISSTFPTDFVLPPELLASGSLQGIDVGSHVLSTYDSAPMIRSIVTEGENVLRRRRHLYEEAYNIDNDEWREVAEDVQQVHDDYYHPNDEDYGSNGSELEVD
ncbi:putative Tubulin FtsZ family [Trypanosoma vivax]|nr:putative Tubulin FtsZ family [Trypanosoma vivax]